MGIPKDLIDAVCSRTLLEEVNDSDMPMEPLHYAVMPPLGGELPAAMASSADAQICAAGAAAEPVTGDKAQASEQSIQQIDLKSPRWTRRYADSHAIRFVGNYILQI